MQAPQGAQRAEGERRIGTVPLHPQLAAYLEAANRPGVPKMWEVGPEGARAMARAGVAAMNPPRQPVADVRDRTIPGPGGPIPVRIYIPAEPAPRGALVYFHGSGFVIYDLDSHDSECRAMCNRAGITVVSCQSIQRSASARARSSAGYMGSLAYFAAR